eukprot:s40_g28.t1
MFDPCPILIGTGKSIKSSPALHIESGRVRIQRSHRVGRLAREPVSVVECEFSIFTDLHRTCDLYSQCDSPHKRWVKSWDPLTFARFLTSPTSKMDIQAGMPSSFLFKFILVFFPVPRVDPSLAFGIHGYPGLRLTAQRHILPPC